MKDVTPHVSNQKDEGFCMVMAMADMIGTALSIYLGKTIVVSPQPLIDAGSRTFNVGEIMDFLSRRVNEVVYGLQQMCTYPFTRIEDPNKAYQERQTLAAQRFTGDRILSYDDPLEIKG